MLAIVFLLVTSLAGFVVLTRVVPSAPAIVRVPGGFLLSVVFTSWSTYLITRLFAGSTPEHALKIGVIGSTLLGVAVLATVGRKIRPSGWRFAPVDAALTAFGLVLSWWLMRAHLRTENGELFVSANTWGDMGLHIALSRSFSVGSNYPPEYPFFAGEPIRYHFGFDFFAGMLQTGGLSVQSSFNLPGILGFTSMMLLMFALARLLFSPAEAPARWWRDRGIWTGLVAVALLITNQSLGWLRYLAQDGRGNLGTALDPSTWWAHKEYLAQGPYTQDPIAMFNTLNVYLTQMHLIVAMALVFLLAYVVIHLLKDGEALDKRLLAAVGVTFGVGFWLNGVVWLAAGIFLGGMLALWGISAVWGARKATGAEGEPRAQVRAQARTWTMIVGAFAVPALVLGIPQAIMLNGGGTGGGLGIHLGYLVCNASRDWCTGESMNPFALADWSAFVQYWWLNEGLFLPLLIAAFFLGNGRDRKIIGAITAIFIWGSVFHVGLDVGGQNHKVFNLWENFGGLYVASMIVAIWIAGTGLVRRGLRIPGVLVRVAAVFATVFLVVTGLIDFMTIKNDFRVSVFGDAAQRQATDWIADDTPLRAKFVTDYDQLYTAPTMAGRGVALGYSSWASSAGYDIEPRKALIAQIYQSPDQASVCALLKQNDFDYVLIGPQERTSPRFKVNDAAFASMTPAATFGSDVGETRIYGVAQNCG